MRRARVHGRRRSLRWGHGREREAPASRTHRSTSWSGMAAGSPRRAPIQGAAVWVSGPAGTRRDPGPVARGRPARRPSAGIRPRVLDLRPAGTEARAEREPRRARGYRFLTSAQRRRTRRPRGTIRGRVTSGTKEGRPVEPKSTSRSRHCPLVERELRRLEADDRQYIEEMGAAMVGTPGATWRVAPGLERAQQLLLWSMRRERGVRPRVRSVRRPLLRARRGGGRPAGRPAGRRADPTRGSPDDGEPGPPRAAVLAGEGRWSR